MLCGVTKCVVPVNENTPTLNMTFVISDIQVHGHRVPNVPYVSLMHCLFPQDWSCLKDKNKGFFF